MKKKCERCQIKFETNLRLKRFCTKRCKNRATDKRCKNRRYKYLKTLRKKAVIFLGGKCVVCGMDDFDVLQIDHIFPIHKRKEERIYHYDMCRKIKNGEMQNVQVLCANCHMKKTRQELWG